MTKTSKYLNLTFRILIWITFALVLFTCFMEINDLNGADISTTIDLNSAAEIIAERISGSNLTVLKAVCEVIAFLTFIITVFSFICGKVSNIVLTVIRDIVVVVMLAITSLNVVYVHLLSSGASSSKTFASALETMRKGYPEATESVVVILIISAIYLLTMIVAMVLFVLSITSIISVIRSMRKPTIMTNNNLTELDKENLVGTESRDTTAETADADTTEKADSVDADTMEKAGTIEAASTTDTADSSNAADN